MEKNKKKLLVIGIMIVIVFIVGEKIVEKFKVPESYYIEGKTNYITDKGYSKSGYLKRFISIIEDDKTFQGYFSKHPEVIDLLDEVIKNDFFEDNSLIVIQQIGVQCYVSRLEIRGNDAIVTLKEDKGKDYNNTFFIPVNSKNIEDVDLERDYSFREDLINALPIVIFLTPIASIIISDVLYKKKKETLDEEKLEKAKTKNLYVKIGATMALVIIIALKLRYR